MIKGSSFVEKKHPIPCVKALNIKPSLVTISLYINISFNISIYVFSRNSFTVQPIGYLKLNIPNYPK